MSYRFAMYSEKLLIMGQRNCPKHVEFYSKNKFEKLVHLVGFIIRIYHDARSPENHFFSRILHLSNSDSYDNEVLAPLTWVRPSCVQPCDINTYCAVPNCSLTPSTNFERHLPNFPLLFPIKLVYEVRLWEYNETSSLPCDPPGSLLQVSLGFCHEVSELSWKCFGNNFRFIF